MVICMDNIIKLLEKEILKQDEKIKSLSIKLMDIKHVYDALIPNKNKRNIIKAEKLKDKDTFYEFIEILAYYNKVLYAKLAEIINEINACKNNDLSYCNDSGRLISQIAHKKKELNKKMQNIMAVSFNYIARFYESLEKEKEEKKTLKKKAEYALKNIKKNFSLTSQDINTITLLIEKEEDFDKEELFNELNNYIHLKRCNIIKAKTETPSRKEKKNYVDDKDVIITEEKEDKTNPVVSNYLTTIRAFNDNLNAINEFLNAISYNDDIEDIISEMLLQIDLNEEKKLHDTISNYLVQITYDEFKEDKLAEDEQVNVLFYDFLNNTSKIVNMIDKNIPKEDYKALLKALEQIKKDGAVANRTTTVLLKKIYKLRVGKIRVTFKRLNHNTYIILGVFRKNNQHGSYIISKTKSRADKLSRYEKSIIESINIPDIWNSYLKINEEIYEGIIEQLKTDKLHVTNKK